MAAHDVVALVLRRAGEGDGTTGQQLTSQAALPGGWGACLVRDVELAEEDVGGLAEHHGAEELAAEPGAAARGDGLLNDGNLRGG